MKLSKQLVLITLVMAFCLCLLQSTSAQDVKGPRAQPEPVQSRFGLPPDIAQDYIFAGQKFPISRSDIKPRIISQINFLLYDARSVMTEWVLEKSRLNWIYREAFAKAGIPEDFVWLAPVMAGATKAARPQGVGAWMLDKPCSSAEGLAMRDDTFMDERLDIQAAVRCFALRLSAIQKEYRLDWFMSLVAYLMGSKQAAEIIEKYGTSNPWDIPLPDYIEDLLDRWIALKIIYTHRQYYGLTFSDPAPFIFDQLSDVRLTKDLHVAEIARILGVSPRLILEINPKIRITPGIFPAKADGIQLLHSIAAPSGKGVQLLKKLQELGYIDDARKL